jgi:rifampicin phosphotransferase
MNTSYQYVLPLHQISRSSSAQTGMKAANLGELLQAGFNVPGGFVLSVSAFERFRLLHGFRRGASDSEVLGAPMPDDVLDELMAAYREFQHDCVAVRSSGVAEDLADASFAGQYETVLGVLGESAIQYAIAKCWASAFSNRVAAYRRDFISDDVPPLAVLVQRLIQPDAAGVAFTMNPISGDPKEILVSAVRGLGERLVSGQAQPDEWSVRAGSATCQYAPEKAVESDQVLRIAALANQVRTHFEAEQDIEWALANDELFLLQARPVTTVATPADALDAPLIEVPDGYWQREITHFPRPTSVMVRDILDTHNAEFRQMCTRYGLLVDGVEIRLIGGWAYARVVPLGGKDQPPPPAWLMWLLLRTAPQLRRRIQSCKRAIRSDLHGRDIDRWYDEWRPSLSSRLHALASVELSEISDEELATHVFSIERLVAHCLHVHFQLHGAMMFVLAEFLFACSDLLGWDDQRAFTLLNGLSQMSTEPSRELADLAEIAASHPRVKSLLSNHENVASTICSVDATFADAFEKFVRFYGCRTMGMEFVEPTLAEQPDLLLRLVRDQITNGYDPRADAAAAMADRDREVAAAREQIGSRPRLLQRFEKALARAQRAYPVREDSEFFTASAPLGLGRLAALEVGRRLVARGQMDAVEDVFCLTMNEQQEAVVSSDSLQSEIQRRREEEARVEANPGPASYGSDPGEPPSFTILPKESRFTMEALQAIMLDRILAPDASARVQTAGEHLSGIAASKGFYTGTARVVMDETEFDKVQPGDVLVCPITSPVWSVLFPSIGALITDTGGILSHAAIIAREYRLPAVVGTGNATDLLSDGDLVTIDGANGTIHVHTFASDLRSLEPH